MHRKQHAFYLKVKNLKVKKKINSKIPKSQKVHFLRKVDRQLKKCDFEGPKMGQIGLKVKVMHRKIGFIFEAEKTHFLA